MVFLIKDEKQGIIEKIISDIGNYNLEEYIKAIIRAKKMYSFDVLRNMNFSLVIDHKERLCIRGIIHFDGEKVFDELIPLYKYSGIFYIGRKKKSFISLEESLYEDTKGYFFKNGVRDKNINFESWITGIKLFQEIPDACSLQQDYRWLK